MTDENAQDAVDATAEEIPLETPAEAVTGAPDGSGEKPTDFAPPSTELVIADVHDDLAVVTALDRNDELQILKELEQSPVKFLAYDFGSGRNRVVDLSYEGVSEIVRQMNGVGGPIESGKCQIAVDPGSLECVTVEEDLGDGPEPCWMATVYGRDEVSGFGQFGTFVQPKFTTLTADTATKREKAGKTVLTTDSGVKKMPNPFARQVALGKAQRNALKLFVPVAVRQAILAKAKGDANLRQTILAGAGAEQMADLPPPLTDERAEAQKTEARSLFDTLRGLNAESLTPAAFHAYLVRAEHSHDRLDEFLAYLKTRIEEATPKEKTS